MPSSDSLHRNASFACSFCGKREPEVRCVLTGPMVYICDECLRLCVEIMRQEFGIDPMTGPCPKAVNVLREESHA